MERDSAARIRYLFKTYLANRCDAQELDELLTYFQLEADSPQLRQLVDEALQNTTFSDEEEAEIDRIIDRNEDSILAEPDGAQRTTTIKWRRIIAVAASMLIALSIGWLVWGDRWSATQEQVADIAPGGNRATLTLADGRTIDLSPEQAGIIVGDENITYNDGSSLDVISSEVEGRRDISLLELTTPKGGTYQVTLPDGSKVWLNAASTLKYPSHFSGDERIVELEGEAYFDVAKAKKQKSENAQKQAWPFKVVSKGQRVEVLGTQFNISAYRDENDTRTTLVEGSVKVSQLTGHVSHLLKPGEQGRMVNDVIEIQQVDTEPYTAWKDGLFVFHNEPLENILKQVSRWYDVEVSYQDEHLRGLILWGKVSRDTPISSVLNALALTEKVQFKLETGTEKERRLTVMK